MPLPRESHTPLKILGSLWGFRPRIREIDHADLGPSLESFVSGLVASGRYASPEEVLREALQLFQGAPPRSMLR